jgi:cyclophilin family peptidyl-prolyl cis-trans isomerase
MLLRNHVMLALIMILLFVLIIISACNNRQTSFSSAPKMQIELDRSYEAVIVTTVGDITLRLFAQEAPVTVNNFVFLAKQRYFDDVIFHRVVRDFVIQTGDPTGTGMGDPGYTFPDELHRTYRYETGIVAMANAGPDSNGSQFFICSGIYCNNLNEIPNYTIFGQVIAGMDIVEQINRVEVDQQDRPLQEIVIKSVTILED